MNSLFFTWFRKSLYLLILIALVNGRATAAAVYSAGHGDIGVEYDAGEDPNGFFVHLHAHAGTIVDGAPLDDDEEYTGGEAVVLVPNSTNIGRTAGEFGGSLESYDFTTPAFNFLGTPSGENLWVLMFDSADVDFYGGPFLGLAAEEGFTPGQWNGSLVFAMTAFSGPGNLALFTAAGTRRWDTQDGSFANDTVNVGPGGHSHFFWSFTAPGVYDVTVSVTGDHKTHGTVTGTDTFRFVVVPEPGSAALLIAGSVVACGYGLRRLGRRPRKGGQR